MAKPRGRDLGLDFPGTPGRHNAITDVAGVLVGFATIIDDDGELVQGSGPVRTGVTAILPRGLEREPAPVWAGTYDLNGNGEMTGTHWIADGGYFVGPICITNTHSVGIVHHAAIRWMLRTHGDALTGGHLWALPVVAETYDGFLNDINGQHVTEAHALAALDGAADGPVAEGNAGGGTGMIAYEFKGGTGTASRRLSIGGEDFTLGALVQANHGRRDWLTVLGVPVGRHMQEGKLRDGGPETGSIIAVIGCDIPMLPHQLNRVARRAALGVGRGGTPGGKSSGDIFLAFTTANRMAIPQAAGARLAADFVNDEHFDPIYMAAIEVVEEAVINAMLAAEPMATVRPPGRTCLAIDHDELVAIMRRYGRCRPA